MIESVVNIFKQLGVDGTIWYQFAIFAILYPLLKFLFFNKLQFVIEHREGRTTKLDSGANKKLDDAKKLSQEFDEIVGRAQNEAQSFVKAEKTKVSESLEKDYKDKEKKVLAQVESEVSGFRTEVEGKKGQILGNAKGLSDSLVEKLT